jgi:hypothetical protein
MFLHPPFFHLQSHKFSGQAHASDIKSVDAFQGDHVTFGKDLQGAISEEIFSAAVVETDFHNPAGTFRIAKGQVGQPIVHIEAIATAGAASAIALASIGFAGPTRGTSHV